MFKDIDIHFQESYIVDARMSADDMKKAVHDLLKRAIKKHKKVNNSHFYSPLCT